MRISPAWYLLTIVVTLLTLTISTSSGQTLFEYNGPVAQLWPNNFTENVFNAPNVWIVMFYASWCGHCRASAPIYTNFSSQLQGWSSVARPAAVACSDAANVRLCRQFGVQGYPTFKLFPPRSDTSFRGISATSLKSGDVTHDLRTVLLTYINQLVASGNADSTWPPLQPVSIPSEFGSWNSDKIYVVAENSAMEDNFVGLAVALDMLSRRSTVSVGRIRYGDQVSRPGLYLYQSGSLTLLSDATTEEAILAAISSHLGEVITTTRGDYTTTIRPTTTLVEFPPPDSPVYRPRGLYGKDVESGIARALWVDIAMHESYSGVRLSTLKSFIDLLARHCPCERRVKTYLGRLSSWLQTIPSTLTEAQWTAKLNELQSSDAYIDRNETYVGCAGSDPKFRGYTCSLWMLFHSLTVSAYNDIKTGTAEDARAVLHKLADYVEYFFSCRHCAHHFGKMAQSIDTNVTSPRDVILWLWGAHNQANNRLHGEFNTEDPQAPKIQFPPLSACPNCRIGSMGDLFEVEGGSWTWNEDAVLQYLISYYSTRVDSEEDEVSDAIRPGSCPNFSSDWSPCSASCDVGVSTRLAVDQSSCSMSIDTRLCMLRPCALRFSDWTRSQWHIDNCPKVAHTYRLSRSQPLTYQGCTSTVSKAWHICGLCPPQGTNRPVCCKPGRSSTMLMDFTCEVPNGGSTRSVPMRIPVEEVNYCVCDENC